MKNGRYRYYIQETPKITIPYLDYALFLMRPSSTEAEVSDRPLHQELITFDYKQYGRLLMGNFEGMKTDDGDISFIISHFNTALLFVSSGYHRFGFTNAIYIMFVCVCFMCLKPGIGLRCVVHIGGCALLTSTLTTVACLLYVPHVIAWTCGSVYTGMCILMMILEHKTRALDVKKLITFCGLFACVMNSNVLM